MASVASVTTQSFAVSAGKSFVSGPRSSSTSSRPLLRTKMAMASPPLSTGQCTVGPCWQPAYQYGGTLYTAAPTVEFSMSSVPEFSGAVTLARIVLVDLSGGDLRAKAHFASNRSDRKRAQVHVGTPGAPIPFRRLGPRRNLHYLQAVQACGVLRQFDLPLDFVLAVSHRRPLGGGRRFLCGLLLRLRLACGRPASPARRCHRG